jgi:hypothetical protein
VLTRSGPGLIRTKIRCNRLAPLCSEYHHWCRNETSDRGTLDVQFSRLSRMDGSIRDHSSCDSSGVTAGGGTFCWSGEPSPFASHLPSYPLPQVPGCARKLFPKLPRLFAQFFVSQIGSKCPGEGSSGEPAPGASPKHQALRYTPSPAQAGARAAAAPANLHSPSAARCELQPRGAKLSISSQLGSGVGPPTPNARHRH